MYIYTHTLNQIKSKKLVRTSFSTRKKKALFYIKQKHHKLRLECTLTRSVDTKLAWVMEAVELQQDTSSMRASYPTSWHKQVQSVPSGGCAVHALPQLPALPPAVLADATKCSKLVTGDPELSYRLI